MMKKKYILPALGILLVLIQFIRIDKTNPPIEMDKDFLAMTNPPESVKVKIKQACYDCHSNATQYPWYANIAPVSWWIKGHIDNGRKHLNFSTWAEYDKDKQDHKVEENIEMLENQWMPLSSYTWLHPEAKMTDKEWEEMIGFFKSLQ